MNCKEFKRILKQAVETRAQLDQPELLAHSAACETCRAVLDRHVDLDRAIQEWRHSVPEIDLADSVLARLAFLSPGESASSPLRGASVATERPRRSRGLRLYLSIASAAAALALAAIALVFWPSEPKDRVAVMPAPQGAVSAPAANVPSTTEIAEGADDMEPAAIVHDAGSAYWTLASRTADTVTQGMALVSTVEPSATPSDPADSATEATWVEDLEDKLGPLRSDFNRAIDVLLETVPEDASSAL
jgi:hypothetical protein